MHCIVRELILLVCTTTATGWTHRWTLEHSPSIERGGGGDRVVTECTTKLDGECGSRTGKSGVPPSNMACIALARCCPSGSGVVGCWRGVGWGGTF